MSKTADKKSVDTSGDESKSPLKKTSGRGRGRGRGRRTKSVPKRANVKTIKTLKSPEAEGSESLLEDQPSTESKLIDKEENQENQGSIFSPLDLTKLDKDKPLSETVEVDLDNFDPLQFAPSSTRLNVPLRSEAVNWCNKVNLIGSKCPTPIHICDKCKEPILYYGRLIPCKHVFCFGCAKGNDGTCLTCSDKVDRTEKNGLGTIYMCSVESCRRTYLSERDRQAHINHRHIIRRTANPVVGSANSISGHTRGSYSSVGTPSKSSSESFQSPIPVVSTRSNLITVPLQGDLSSMYASHSGTQLQWPGISQTSFPHHGYNPSGRYENYTSSGGGGSGSGTSGSTQWPGAGQSSTHQNPFSRNYYQQ